MTIFSSGEANRIGSKAVGTVEVPFGFALWSRSFTHLDEALNLLAENFLIKGVFRVRWSDEFFVENVRRLYEIPSFKNDRWMAGFVEKMGAPEFVYVVGIDRFPNCRFERLTSGSVTVVNARVTAIKKEIRKWFIHSFAIHSSNNTDEFWSQATLILGSALVRETLRAPHRLEQDLRKDLEGSGGWESVAEMFDVLNASAQYVVLRDAPHIRDGDVPDDIDLLARDFQAVASAVNMKQNRQRPYKGLVDLGGRDIAVDIRFLGDGYYDPLWASRILLTRIMDQRLYVPESADWFFSLLYHSLAHKVDISQKNKEELLRLSGELRLDWSDSSNLPAPQTLVDFLAGFMASEGFKVSVPVDQGVQLQRTVSRKLPGHTSLRLQRRRLAAESFAERSVSAIKRRTKRLFGNSK